ncbi:hypothetical protein DN069_28810 [Streptacidiphilus pinicola]|uniref:Mycothiol-dependent maleylpyruvate isomerase metal-binding domain-containing protein n=1 Tax=Streptacidiphilus pinicola TaxID=2219663 RepID=A0A2X0JZ42_9ACTN|nr:maleylpyruvate isomerase N-terminal domain-containing protein [Streptacidiphilus pinicola]RAG82215.1 hypothetical protein DN069_28810 [Streptacidiphilus pinicola]
MTTVEPDLDLLRAVLGRESARLADALRGDAAPLDRQVPGLDWTVGELASHLSSVYELFAGVVRGEHAPDADGGATEGGEVLRETVTAANRERVATVRFATGDEAADVLRAGARDLLDALHPGIDLTARRATPWYGPGATMPVGSLAALSVTESLVHGYDLDRALGRRARIADDAAAAAVPTVMSTMMPLLFDAKRVGDRRLGFEVRIRGGRPFVLRIADGRCRAEPAGASGSGEPVDCVISLTGAAALHTGFSRRPLWRAMATGGAFAFGRRPWLGPTFHTLFLRV